MNEADDIAPRRGDFTLLVNTCDGFEDCWRPFFLLLKKYWPTMHAPILLNTESKAFSFAGLDIECAKVQAGIARRLTWSECLIAALAKVRTPLVLYMQEDYFLSSPVRADVVGRAVRYMMEHPEVAHLGLTRHGSRGPFKNHEESWLQVIAPRAGYRISTQAGLWRVDSLRSYLVPEENGWMFEIYGTWRAHRQPDCFLCARFDEASGGPVFDYLHTGIIKGKWLPEMRDVFADNQIEVDFARRGFYRRKHPVLRKIETGLRLLERPGYLVKQILRLPATDTSGNARRMR